MSISMDMAREMDANENMRPYAWVITKDYLTDGTDDETGKRGPGQGRFGYVATEEDFDLAESIGRTFLIRDDDGEPYYEGKIWTSAEPGDDLDFRPLEDFGAPNAGATEIYYKKLKYCVIDKWCDADNRIIDQGKPGYQIAECNTAKEAENLIIRLAGTENRYEVKYRETDEWDSCL